MGSCREVGGRPLLSLRPKLLGRETLLQDSRQLLALEAELFLDLLGAEPLLGRLHGADDLDEDLVDVGGRATGETASLRLSHGCRRTGSSRRRLGRATR